MLNWGQPGRSRKAVLSPSMSDLKPWRLGTAWGTFWRMGTRGGDQESSLQTGTPWLCPQATQQRLPCGQGSLGTDKASLLLRVSGSPRVLRARSARQAPRAAASQERKEAARSPCLLPSSGSRSRWPGQTSRGRVEPGAASVPSSGRPCRPHSAGHAGPGRLGTGSHCASPTRWSAWRAWG